jgi:ATP-dependent Clp protease ATP-binding subunit ClpX
MNKRLTCSFCGKGQTEVDKLLAGHNDVHICDRCVDLCYNVLDKESKNKQVKNKKKRLAEIFETPIPSQIHSYLDEHVIGQDHVKKKISVAVYNHCKRIFNQTRVPVQKSNVLLIGPTGVGKTLLAQTLAEFLDVPFVITDATTITESGYAGDDAEVLIHKLFQNADYDIDKTEIGIIYVDEIDKKAKRNDLVNLSRDVSGEGVQQSLLKLMEGTVLKIPNKHGANPEYVDIDTTNILFIVGGAFVGLRDLVLQRIGKNKIGFGDNAVKVTDIEWEDNLETRDLVQYGLIPEFVGRLPSISVLRDLSKQDMLRILTEPKYSIVKQFQALFELDKIELEFNIKALEKIVDMSIEQNLGARGLRKILDSALLDVQYNLPKLSEQHVEKIIVTEQTIAHGIPPIMIKGSIS